MPETARDAPLGTGAPLFSVVIPTYGRQAFLDEAIQSVLDQDLSDLEIIVVDDAGPEPADPPSHPRVQVVRHSTNSGPAVARNTGIERASGRYLTFLDDDDLWEPSRLSRVVPCLEAAPIAACRSTWLDDETEFFGSPLPDGNVHDVILDGYPPHLGAVAVRRERALLFDPEFIALQDADWWLRMSPDNEVRSIPFAGHRFRRHRGPRGLNDQSERIRCGALLLQKHDVYFESHPRAAAFRLERNGLLQLTVGADAEAARTLWRSFRTRPTAHRASLVARVTARRFSR